MPTADREHYAANHPPAAAPKSGTFSSLASLGTPAGVKPNAINIKIKAKIEKRQSIALKGLHNATALAKVFLPIVDTRSSACFRLGSGWPPLKSCALTSGGKPWWHGVQRLLAYRLRVAVDQAIRRYTQDFAKHLFGVNASHCVGEKEGG